MHGGVKLYRGSAAAARSYVEVDHSRADDYYLAEGCGVAEHYAVSVREGAVRMDRCPDLDGPGYERWVAVYDVTTGKAKGRLRDDHHALRFVEVVVNGPKTWSLAAALHPDLAEPHDAAQTRAAEEIIDWIAQHGTTRVGPRGRQVQIVVEQIEAAVVRHYTSRAGDPHRHLHLQINARVFAAGAWRGLHSVGVVYSIEALNGIGHAAVLCDPEFRTALAAHGYTLDDAGEVSELAPYVGRFSERSSQIARNMDRYEAQWRADHPGQEPGPKLRCSWDRRAWAEARPDKVIPKDGSELVTRWNDELHELGFRAPVPPAGGPCPKGSERLKGRAPAIGAINHDVAVEVMLLRLGAKRSAWNAADIRGEAEKVIASVGVIAERGVRIELAEDLTSDRVLAVEAELVDTIAARSQRAVVPAPRVRGTGHLDRAQQRQLRRMYLDRLEDARATQGVGIWVTPGNHEDWGSLTRFWADPANAGQPLHLTKHIVVLPRGYRFELERRTFVSRGGAPSVDLADRSRSTDWWRPEEMITPEDVGAVVAGGDADVLLAHGRPARVVRGRSRRLHPYPQRMGLARPCARLRARRSRADVRRLPRRRTPTLRARALRRLRRDDDRAARARVRDADLVA